MSIAALRARLRDESGMTLVEVMTSAVLLVVVSLGVTKGIDTASNISGMSKHKTTASMLAQQDQERMRSFASPTLADYNDTRTRTVRGVPFTVVSAARWVSDVSGTESCVPEGIDGDDAASYLRITSTVTWPEMRGMKPVVATSLVAPPNGSFGDQGALMVEILDRNAEGLAAIDVTATPLAGVTSALTQPTGSSGCAFFGYLPPVNYRVTFERADHVTTQGVQAVSQDVGVATGATNRVSFLYDRAATLDANVVTRYPGQPSDVAATAEYLTVGHSGLADPGTRRFGTGTPSPAFTAESMFPFTSPYSVYSGACPGANPALNGASGVDVTLPPGGSDVATVREVGLGFHGESDVKELRLVSTTAGCSDSLTIDVADGVLHPRNGRDAAVPYGSYGICIRREVLLGSLLGDYKLIPNVQLNQAGGYTVDASQGSWSTSPCM